MKVLAIETSCDETAVAVLEYTEGELRVLSNIISSQIDLHAPFGGVVPALAAREHAANIEHVFTSALKEAGIVDPEREINLLTVTRGPGLGPALLVGITFARTLAWRWNLPLIGVNHMDGHIHSNWIPTVDKKDQIPDIAFPALNVVVSGGHTELVLMRDHGDYTIIGETQDDAIGEAFDKVARMLGLGYPGGPKVSKLATEGDLNAYPLPRPMATAKNYDFSYSGLKTAVLYLIRDITEEKRELTQTEKANIAASFQHAAVDVLIIKTKRAAEDYQVKSILLSGGVSANTLLRERLRILANDLNLYYSCPAMTYTTDNAAMIGVAGYYQYIKKSTASSETVDMDANLRLGT
jgi:N6-L-threonylcarbamoyladenine synthase